MEADGAGREDLLPVVLVCDLYVTGLSMMRDFAMQGVPVIGIDPNPKRVGFFTKYGRKMVCPNPVTAGSELVKWLCRIGSNTPNGGVLFPTSDDFALFISQYRNELRQYFKFALPDHAVMQKLVSKWGLVQIADEAGFSSPRTYMPKNREEAVRFSKEMEYPCVIKPELAYSWRRDQVVPYTGGRKVIQVWSPRELLETYDRLAGVNGNLIFQEIIPGEDDQLCYFASYLNGDSEPLAVFAGRKLRIMPIHFGSATCAESFYDSQLEAQCIHLLRTCKYRGLSGIEVKKDRRDGAYKLIEINARFGLWDSLGRRCGVDLALTAYRDLTTGRTVRRKLAYRTGVKWIYLANDLRAFLYYRKEGTLSFRKWVRSLRGEKEWALLSLKDPIPAVRTFLHMAEVGLGHLRRRQLVSRVENDAPLVFVLGASPNGLSFIRSLGRKGVSVIALDSAPSPGLYSRYCEGIALPEIEDNEKIWLEFLIERGKRLSCKAALIPTGDAHVLLVSRNRELLSPYFNFSLPEQSVVEAVTSKRTQYGLAKELGVAIPRTYYPETVSEVESLSHSVSYPCILKPYYSHLWQKYSRKRKEYKMAKLVVVNDQEGLVEAYKRMARSGMGIMVQERIPGQDAELFSFLTYCGEDSNPMAVFTKRKLRQTQAGYGDGSFQESVWEPTVVRLGMKLLRSLRWRGLACIEFKKDPRDGKFKLIEVNPRSFTGVDMAVKSGVDLPDIVYRDLAGHKAPRISTFSEGVKWVHLTWDVAAALLHRRERRITLTEWLKSLRGQKSFAIWSSDDPLPFIMLLFSAFRTLPVRLLCRLKSGEHT